LEAVAAVVGVGRDDTGGIGDSLAVAVEEVGVGDGALATLGKGHGFGTQAVEIVEIARRDLYDRRVGAAGYRLLDAGHVAVGVVRVGDAGGVPPGAIGVARREDEGARALAVQLVEGRRDLLALGVGECRLV